jgi:mannose-6-phosphate isomerase-like protein (cupin superfamily)
MKYSNYSIGGTVVKNNETYLLTDNTELKNLVLSSTRLHANMSTRGHQHEGQEEVYLFISGAGKMQLGEESNTFEVRAGDTVLIQDGVFHRVFNTSNAELYFICIFDGKRNH